MANSGSSTAGRGDPYWYEWFVGLIEVVKLLDEDSGVESVAFQVEGLNGWDDVIVSLRDGKRRCYQIKHSRVGNTFTFGDLVQNDDENDSLLSSLFKCWREAGLNDQKTECILYTNREAGSRWSTKKTTGSQRPPLLEFYQWLSSELVKTSKWSDIIPCEQYRDAWTEWESELSAGSDKQKCDFIRSLTIKSKQEDLEGLDVKLRKQLSDAFGIEAHQTDGIFNALCRALKKWTTGYGKVTVEALCMELAIIPEPIELAISPPPPVPFFPTRIPLAEELEELLISDSSEPVIFLTGEPGAGKTSVVSYLENRRESKPFTGLINTRFYCFDPILPNSPFIPPDATRVTPKELWYSLLSQLKFGLKGRLFELKVPLRNDFLTWQQAREHVLRLADIIGEEQGQGFVIVIDGIDHAARSAQTMPQDIKEFFDSLPGPQALNSLNVKMLIAGQPPENYRLQYPDWLQGHHTEVRRIELQKLDSDDIRELYLSSSSSLPTYNTEDVIRVIEQTAKGNTLATVFAVAEAENSQSLEEFTQNMNKNRLADGLEAYYSNIWNHMLQTVGTDAQQVEQCLSGAISLAQHGVSGELFASAFHDWEKPPAWWQKLLNNLSPLMTKGAEGYQVRHNDVRVFLSRRFSTFSDEEKQDVASHLADYYLNSHENRYATHLQLFELLNLSGRIAETASIFNVNWVLEAAAEGVDTDKLLNEAQTAISSLPLLQNWSAVVSVACAVQTLEKLKSAREFEQDTVPVKRQTPPFFPSESKVLPFSEWGLSDLQGLIYDANELVENNKKARALGLLKRWLSDLTLSDIVSKLRDSEDEFDEIVANGNSLNRIGLELISDFGYLCGKLNWKCPIGIGDKSSLEPQAVNAFEEGFVKSIEPDTDAKTLDELFDQFEPQYLPAWDAILRKMVEGNRWTLVSEILLELVEERDQLEPALLAEATWWAIRCNLPEEQSAIWLSPLGEVDFGVSSAPQHRYGTTTEKQRIAPFLNIARALGWVKASHDPGDIASSVFQVYENLESGDYRGPTTLLFRTAALLGKLSYFEQNYGLKASREIASPDIVRQMLETLWRSSEIFGRSFRYWGIGVNYAEELSLFCIRLGKEYKRTTLDVALKQAESYPSDFRLSGLWKTIQQSGDNDEFLQHWVKHWLAEDGLAWDLSHDELHHIIEVFSSLVFSIGEQELVELACNRAKWLQVEYLDRKEYCFNPAYNWFKTLSKRSPNTWDSLGWKLWLICEKCSKRGGDNRYEPQLMNAISAAAIKCGPTDWFRLISSTFHRMNGTGWHDEVRERLVDGATETLLHGAKLSDDDLLTIYCLAISFSFWAGDDDNSSLKSLRQAMIDSHESPEDRQEFEHLLKSISQRQFITSADENSDESEQDESKHPEVDYEFSKTIESIESGGFVSLEIASRAIETVIAEGNSKRDQLIPQILRSVSTCSDDYGFITEYPDGALGTIAKSTSDEELWSLIESFSQDVKNTSSFSLFGVHNNLLEIAHSRACNRSIDEHADGLSTQLEMHFQWMNGKNDSRHPQLGELPVIDEPVSWQDVAVQFICKLLESYSSEVIGAALEGLHNLIALKPSLIPVFYEKCVSGWSRRWLLSASESWAVLHPKGFSLALNELNDILHNGAFEEKLQAWINLCLYSDECGIERPEFPIPKQPANRNALDSSKLLDIPPENLGERLLVDHRQTALRKIRRLKFCGFDFSSLEGEIRKRLYSHPDTNTEGPHRWNSFNCSPLDSELVVGEVLESVISQEEFTQDDIPLIAQLLLSHEDAWLQRKPPQPVWEKLLWPYKWYHDKTKSKADVQKALTDIALHGVVQEGWKVFLARIHDSYWKEDISLSIWWEQIVDEPLFATYEVPTTPNGRTFSWSLGEFVDPSTGNSRFVSGNFAGGLVRLSFCNLTLQPSTAWKTVLNWCPDPHNPFVWYSGEDVVAKLERFHGPLRNSNRTETHRQSVVERWLVTNEGFQQVEETFGSMRRREEFEAHEYSNR